MPRTRYDDRDENLLLAALPLEDYRRMVAGLETVDLHARQLLILPEREVSRIYFLRNAVVSLLVPMEDGAAVEGATIGNEGMVGLETFMGDGVSHAEMVVQIGGTAARIDPLAFHQIVNRSV